MALLWRHFVDSAVVSLVWCTVSKAFDRSIAIATVCSGEGRGLLKFVATLSTSDNRAEVVNVFFWTPCWESDRFRCRLRYGRSNGSRTLRAGQRREIG